MFRGLRAKLPGRLLGWWSHRTSFAISLVVTFLALSVYYATFLGERPTPLFEFILRLEMDTLDTRFRLRGRVAPDPRIVIVDIDQHSQEVLGAWPFPRSNFATLLDNLREDGARVVAFDVTFSKPGNPLLPVGNEVEREPNAKDRRRAMEELAGLEKFANYDARFAQSIQRFGRVVLGNYFLYTRSDLEGVSPDALKKYADLLAFFTYPQVRPLSAAVGAQGYARMIQNYEDLHLLPSGAEANIPALTEALAEDQGGCGFFVVPADADGVTRRAMLALPYGLDPDHAQWDMYPSLDVEAYRLYLGVSKQQSVLVFGPAGIVSLEFGSRVAVRPDAVGRLLINYRGGVGTYPYISMASVVQKVFPPGTFRDKLVLVGATATGIQDLRATPFGFLDFPGVEVHANVLDNMLNHSFLERGPPQALVDLSLILLFGLVLGAWLAVVSPRWLFLALLLLIPFAVLETQAFARGWWLNFITPSLLTLVPNVVLVSLYRVLVEDREKRKVRGAFQQYLSPEVIRQLLDNPEQVRPRKTALTVMFVDIRGFTRISEALDPQALASFVNEYLTEMTRIIFRHQGTLDKYIGDAVMAFWGAPFEKPDHAQRACAAALDMGTRLQELQPRWATQGLPPIAIGIGINTGTCSVGNMGSDLRYGYTALGDAVNQAARVEGLNKEYFTRVIFTESAHHALDLSAFVYRELDCIRVKGKELPVTVYELLGHRDHDSQLAELAGLFAKGRDAYKRHSWAEAREAFAAVLSRWPEDGPAQVFLARSQEFMAEAPPGNWDGVYVMKHK